jgi:hypothetical protein
MSPADIGHSAREGNAQARTLQDFQTGFMVLVFQQEVDFNSCRSCTSCPAAAALLIILLLNGGLEECQPIATVDVFTY